MRPRGSTQESVLKALREHGCWYVGCGWTWTTYSQTQKIMDSLVRRGDVIVENGRYTARESS